MFALQQITQRSVIRRPLLAALNSQLAARLTYPHGVDRFIELFDATAVRDATIGTITAIEHPTYRSVRVRIRPNANWQGFKAGQYVALGVEINARRARRCFSPAQSQHADGELEFTMAVQPQGRVTQYLKQQAAVGERVVLEAAAGQFSLPDTRPEQLILISAGSGITPVMSMLRTLIDEQYTGSVDFIHYALDSDEELYSDELDALAGQLSNLRIHRIHTQAGGERFSREQLARLVPDYARAQTYVCGPGPLLGATQELFDAEGLSERMHQEAYGVAKPTGDEPAEGEVRFAQSERLMTNSGETLLDQAEAAGLSPEHGCRMGVCFACTCTKTSGRVRDLRSGQLSDDGEADIQICVSVPEGTVALDI